MAKANQCILKKLYKPLYDMCSLSCNTDTCRIAHLNGCIKSIIPRSDFSKPDAVTRGSCTSSKPQSHAFGHSAIHAIYNVYGVARTFRTWPMGFHGFLSHLLATTIKVEVVEYIYIYIVIVS